MLSRAVIEENCVGVSSACVYAKENRHLFVAAFRVVFAAAIVCYLG
jgi:hypothetical protein